MRACFLALILTLTILPAALAGSAMPDTGVSFDGNGTYARVAGGKAFDLDRFSLAAWVKLESLRSPQVFLGRGGRGEMFTLYLYNDHIRMLVEYAPGQYTHADGPLPALHTWTHYLGTYDGTEIRLYTNGLFTSKAAAPGRLPHSDAPLYLGAEAYGSTLNGQMEDVRIWKRALNEKEAAQVAAGEAVAVEDLLARWTNAQFDGKTWTATPGATLRAEYRNEPGRTPPPTRFTAPAKLILTKDDGYHGIWYYNQPSHDEYVYKYSGGLGTYPANHIPFAVYAPAVNKTFFCYGGTTTGENRELLHMVSYYDHATGLVPRPTILLNKGTDDAHDNPVISLDDAGYLWIFSSSHGTSRPSYICRSTKPYNIDHFENVLTTNFSYPQVWHLPGQGFFFLHTRYEGGRRCLYFMTSSDGRQWSEGKPLAKIEEGHYQVSGCSGKKVGTSFMFNPKGKGLNGRTNLYYMESDDFGKTWHNAAGEALVLPLTAVQNKALVHDYQSEGLNVYIEDLSFDSQRHPVILYITSKGYESGPGNGPRIWHTVRWTGNGWDIQGSITSESNYDCGSLYLQNDALWRLIGPTQPGPQQYNPGGEVALWQSADQGKTWSMARQLTSKSPFNHTYVRRPVAAHPDFAAFWADGNPRQPSESRLYFCDQNGEHVRRLPTHMTGEFARPEPVK